jgi:hypothetical protein
VKPSFKFLYWKVYEVGKEQATLDCGFSGFDSGAKNKPTAGSLFLNSVFWTELVALLAILHIIGLRLYKRIVPYWLLNITELSIVPFHVFSPVTWLVLYLSDETRRSWSEIGYGLLHINYICLKDKSIESRVKTFLGIPLVLVSFHLGGSNKGTVCGPEIIPLVPVLSL